MTEQIDVFPVRIVSHHPVPLTMPPPASGPIVAVRRRGICRAFYGSTIVPVGSWNVGQGRNLRRSVLGQRIVASYDVTGFVAEGDCAVGVLGH
jgi:hypothetical protein